MVAVSNFRQGKQKRNRSSVTAFLHHVQDSEVDPGGIQQARSNMLPYPVEYKSGCSYLFNHQRG